MINLADGVGSKKFFIAACLAQAAGNVFGDLITIKGIEMELDRDPLIQLFDVVNNRLQFRLADQDQRQEKAVAELEIQEEPNFFKGFFGNQLCFVDDENCRLVHLLVFENSRLDHVPEIDFKAVFGIEAELVAYFFNKFHRFKAGIGNQSEIAVYFGQFLNEDSAQGRFAASDFPGQHGRSLFPLNRIEEPDERLFVFRGIIHEFRIGNVLEGVFVQSPVF